MPFKIIRNDLTRVAADAIVNTANPEPKIGAGTDTAVYKAAGAEQLLAARQKIGTIHPGEAAVTPGFDLPAKYIIHTVGPVWVDGTRGEEETLRSCYRKCLLLAEQLRCESIAFPLISTGSYGFPKEKALPIALSEIEVFLKDSDMEVTLVVLGREALRLSEALTGKVEQFLNDHMAETLHKEERTPFPGSGYAGGIPEDAWDRRERQRRQWTQEVLLGQDMERPPEPMAYSSAPSSANAAPPSAKAEPPEGSTAPRKAGKRSRLASVFGKRKLEDIVRHTADTFQESLLHLIDEKGYTDTEVYKRANLDRRLFSKIRSNKDYQPSKKTALALSVALRLNLDETKDLIGRAGYALSDSSRFDLIVRYFIENEIYDILEINLVLFDFGEQLLA